MSGGGGFLGGGKQNVTQTWQPPDYALPGWQSYVSGVQQLAGQPYQQYQGQQVAEQNPYELTAYDLGTQRAMYGAPDINSARGMATDFTGGNYLNSNPWLQNDYTDKVIAGNADQMAKAFGLGTAAQNDALAARQGAYGGSAWNLKQSNDAQNLATAIGNMANQYQLGRTNLGVQDYQQGLQQMLAAGALSGNLSQDDWRAFDVMNNIGAQNRNYEQNMLNAAASDYQKAINWPYQQQSLLGDALRNASGGGTTTTQTPGASPLTNLLGLALGGMGLYGMGQNFGLWGNPSMPANVPILG